MPPQPYSSNAPAMPAIREEESRTLMQDDSQGNQTDPGSASGPLTNQQGSRTALPFGDHGSIVDEKCGEDDDDFDNQQQPGCSGNLNSPPLSPPMSSASPKSSTTNDNVFQNEPTTSDDGIIMLDPEEEAKRREEKRRRFRAEAILVVVCVLVFAAIILGVVFGVRNGNPSNEEAYAQFLQGLPAFTRDAMAASDQSPQALAAAWTQHDPYLAQYWQQDNNGVARVRQRFALAVFYYAMGGTAVAWPHAAASPDWLMYQNSTHVHHECDWTGVGTCRSDGTLVILGSALLRGLYGALPPEVVFLSYLQQIDLSGALARNWAFLNDAKNDTIVFIPQQTLEMMLPMPYLGQMSNLQNINYAHNGLRGSIPTTVGDLAFIQQLDWSENDLTGILPTELGLLDQVLQVFNLENNPLLDHQLPSDARLVQLLLNVSQPPFPFTGTIPTEIGLWTDMTRLELAHGDHHLVGTLPTEFGLMTSLEYLSLSWNANITGSIPTELAMLSDSLQVLNLYANKLTGVALPTEFGQLTKLVTLQLAQNPALSGSIPSELGLLSSNFQELLLEDANELYGMLPTEVAQLTNMIQFRVNQRLLYQPNLELMEQQLAENDPQATMMPAVSREDWEAYLAFLVLFFDHDVYSGTIPTQVGLWQRAWFLQHKATVFGVTLPSEVGLMTALREITVEPLLQDGRTTYNASLAGSIPTEIGRVVDLKRVRLTGGMSGKIPSEIGLLISSTRLDLAGNRLSGRIPTELGDCTSLKELDLHANNLANAIPAELGRLVDLQQLHLEENNNLEAPFPAEVCAIAGPKDGFGLISASWCVTWRKCCDPERFTTEPPP